MAALVGNGGQVGGGGNQVQINLTEAEKLSIDNVNYYEYFSDDTIWVQ